jgi:hypothetical protein
VSQATARKAIDSALQSSCQRRRCYGVVSILRLKEVQFAFALGKDESIESSQSVSGFVIVSESNLRNRRKTGWLRLGPYRNVEGKISTPLWRETLQSAVHPKICECVIIAV